MPNTYVGRNVGKMFADHLVAGSGDLISSATAKMKSDELKSIQQRYFHDTSEYTNTAIADNDCLTAIKYVRSKKLTKSYRKGVTGGTKMAAFVAGAATGATVGSVVPVAGTLVGGALGGVAVGAAASVGISITDRLKRSAKGIYKHLRGTRGVHREQAAAALLNCYHLPNHNDVKFLAALEALIVILGEEFDEVMASKAPEKRLADRMQSN